MNIEIEPQEVIFLMPTCLKYADKADAIRETWAKDLLEYGFRHLFLMGRPDLKEAVINSDILYVPCRDDYESLLLKLVLGYEFLYENMDFKYVYKIDDDCYPDLDILVNSIVPQLNGKEYAGGVVHPFGGKMIDDWHFGKCSDSRFDQPYKYDMAPFSYAYGGYGYFLHKDSLCYIIGMKSELESELTNCIYSYEDVRVAEILEQQGIVVTPLKHYTIISGANYNNSGHYLVYDIQNPTMMKLIYTQRTEAYTSSHKDSCLNHYFDHIYVVNLKSEVPDRLTITKHLSEKDIDFEIFEATNGFAGEPLDRFKTYQKRELGDFKRYPKFSETEKRRAYGYIESAGAMGYIYTYIRILKDAKKSGYKRFLILEDDVLLSKNFDSKFTSFIDSVGQDWKLLQLGASQYGWESVDFESASRQGFYFPKVLDTCGSFAIALDSSIIDELIEAESAFEAPFDHLPMGELYERYLGKCFVAFPNIVVPDVSSSIIRGKRSQYEHSKTMRWQIEDFDYPLDKPSISIIITDRNNLKYYSEFSKPGHLPYSLRLFFRSSDGLRPLHSADTLDNGKNIIVPMVPSEKNWYCESDYLAIIDKDEILTEKDIAVYLEYKLKIQKKNITPLKTLEAKHRKIINGRVSVIIPTYKRPKSLRSALASVAEQDYPDIEIIVVSDNGKNSKFTEEMRQIVSSFYRKNSNCSVILLEHNDNRNGAAARNTGIMNSTGEYICFLDDDDLYLPGRLSKSIKALKRTKKTVGAVYCGYLGWKSPENDLSRYKSGDLTLEILLLDFQKHYLHTNTATYKREAVLNINGFDETYRRHQDLEFNLRFFEQYTIGTVNECLVHINPEHTNVNNRVYNMDMVKIKEKFLKQFSYLIEAHNESIATAIHKAHLKEAELFISEKDAFLDILEVNTLESFIHLLKFNIQEDNQEQLKSEHKLILDSVSNLLGSSLKKSPIQKLSAYKSLADVFAGLQKKR